MGVTQWDREGVTCTFDATAPSAVVRLLVHCASSLKQGWTLQSQYSTDPLQ